MKGVSMGMAMLALVVCTRISPEQETALAAFQAIAGNDWEAYQQLTITEADLTMKANKISRSEAKLSFAGGVLKPRQQEKHRQDFEKAVDMGLPAKAILSRLSLVQKSSIRLLTGEEVAASVYAMEDEGGEPDYPRIWLVAWGSFFRVVSLEFPMSEH